MKKILILFLILFTNNVFANQEEIKKMVYKSESYNLGLNKKDTTIQGIKLKPITKIEAFKHSVKKNYGYYSNAKTIDFPIATNNSIETVKTAISILESIFKNGYRYQKAGVMLTGLRNDDGRKNLFSSEKDEKIKSLMRSIDNTNYRYGRSTLSLASAGVHKRWNMRRQYSSKIDTADFYCLPTIRAV